MDGFQGAKREGGQEETFELSFEIRGQVHLVGGEGPRQWEREALSAVLRNLDFRFWNMGISQGFCGKG